MRYFEILFNVFVEIFPALFGAAVTSGPGRHSVRAGGEAREEGMEGSWKALKGILVCKAGVVELLKFKKLRHISDLGS